jgi:hypothetical protein
MYEYFFPEPQYTLSDSSFPLFCRVTKESGNLQTIIDSSIPKNEKRVFKRIFISYFECDPVLEFIEIRKGGDAPKKILISDFRVIPPCKKFLQKDVNISFEELVYIRVDLYRIPVNSTIYIVGDIYKKVG